MAIGVQGVPKNISAKDFYSDLFTASINSRNFYPFYKNKVSKSRLPFHTSINITLALSTGCPMKKVSIKKFQSELLTALIHNF